IRRSVMRLTIQSSPGYAGNCPPSPGSTWRGSDRLRLRPGIHLSGRPDVFPFFAGQRIPEVIAGLLGQGLQPADDVRVLLGHVFPFADVVPEVVEFQSGAFDAVAVA